MHWAVGKLCPPFSTYGQPSLPPGGRTDDVPQNYDRDTAGQKVGVILDSSKFQLSCALS